MTEDQRSHIIYALGLTRRGGRGKLGRRWACRNFYAAGEGAESVWRDLEASGFAREILGPSTLFPHTIFAVTRAGMIAAGVLAYVPELLRGDLT